jgi:hypothetical protein
MVANMPFDLPSRLDYQRTERTPCFRISRKIVTPGKCLERRWTNLGPVFLVQVNFQVLKAGKLIIAVKWTTPLAPVKRKFVLEPGRAGRIKLLRVRSAICKSTDVSSKIF